MLYNTNWTLKKTVILSLSKDDSPGFDKLSLTFLFGLLLMSIGIIPLLIPTKFLNFRETNQLITTKKCVMIIVHDIFICKPGNASKLAKLFKETMANMSELDCIMTDMTGQYNRVIMVMKFENLAAYEKSFEKYMHDTDEMKKMKEMMKGYHDMYLTGSREIYKVA